MFNPLCCDQNLRDCVPPSTEWQTIEGQRMDLFVSREFDQFVETFSGLHGSYILRTAQVRDWRLRTMDLNGVTVMLGAEGAGRVYDGRAADGWFHIFMVLGNGYGVTMNGVEFDSGTVAWIVPNKTFLTSSDKPLRWLNIAISAELVLQWAAEHQDEFDARLLNENFVRRTSQSPLSLISLVRRLYRMNKYQSQQLHTPEAEEAARTELLDALFGLLLPVPRGPDPHRRGANHMKLLNSALRLLELRNEDAIRTEDLCAATGVSERTLRNVFQNYVGMSPHRYLMVRRLHAIRSGIRQAAPEDTITRICAQFGVWDLGRFSRQYRLFFGELPSHSLYCAKGSMRQKAIASVAEAP